MSKRRPTDAELGTLLNQGPFGADHELPAADPLEPTPLLLDLDQIEPYARNPRRSRNPLYDAIEDSIRHQGLQQPLVVTRAPGSARFVVKAGGNTRLAVLRALHEETHEPRFARVHCLFEPWTTESQVLAAHLIENDTRGELTFIDKARAVRELRTLLEAEIGDRLTQAQLSSTLKIRGYRLERSMLSRMDYALDVLGPRLPRALAAGMGQPQIQRIRQLERAAARIWEARELGPSAEFDAVFGALLGRHDGAEWQLEQLHQALEHELADRTGDELRPVSLDLEAALRAQPTRTGPDPAPAPIPTEDVGASASQPEAAADNGGVTPARSSTASLRATSASETSASMAAPPPRSTQPDTSPGPSEQPGNAPLITGDAGKQAALEPDPTARSDQGSFDLASLRTRAGAIAACLAARHELGDIVVPIGDHGAGFLVDFVYTGPEDDEDTKLARATLWWFLATVAEQFHAPPETLARRLPDAWRAKPIGDAIVDRPGGRQIDLLAEYTLVGIGPLVGPLLIARLDDRDWAELLELLEIYRTLHDTRAPTGRALWTDAP